MGDLAAAYSATTKTITVVWGNPEGSSAATYEVILSKDGTQVQSKTIESVKTTTCSFEGIEADGSVYTVSVCAVSAKGLKSDLRTFEVTADGTVSVAAVVPDEYNVLPGKSVSVKVVLNNADLAVQDTLTIQLYFRDTAFGEPIALDSSFTATLTAPAESGNYTIKVLRNGELLEGATCYLGVTLGNFIVWHDESCGCGGTVTAASDGADGIKVTVSNVHDGTTNKETWRVNTGYPFEYQGEGPYLVTFQAKAESERTTYLKAYDRDNSIGLFECVPLELTTSYKDYSCIVWLPASDKFQSTEWRMEFELPEGTTYLRNLSACNLWADGTEGDSTPWSIWQDGSTFDCNAVRQNEGGADVINAGHVTIYEMTQNSVKSVIRDGSMKKPENWQRQVRYQVAENSAGKYRVSFDASECVVTWSEFLLDVEVLYWNEATSSNVYLASTSGLQVSDGGKYYFYYDLPDVGAGKTLWVNFMKNSSSDGSLILSDMKVEKVESSETSWESGEEQGYQRVDATPTRTIDLGSGWKATGRFTESSVTASDASESGITVTLNKDMEEFSIASPEFTYEAGKAYLVTMPSTTGGFSHHYKLDWIETVDGGMILANLTDEDITSGLNFSWSSEELIEGAKFTVSGSSYTEVPIDIKEYSGGWESYFIGRSSSSFKVDSSDASDVAFTLSGDSPYKCELYLPLSMELGKSYTLTGNVDGSLEVAVVGNFYNSEYESTWENTFDSTTLSETGDVSINCDLTVYSEEDAIQLQGIELRLSTYDVETSTYGVGTYSVSDITVTE